MAQKVIRTGNSIAVTIPSEFAKDLGIHVGDEVKVKLEKEKGKMILAFESPQQLPLSEIFAQK